MNFIDELMKKDIKFRYKVLKLLFSTPTEEFINNKQDFIYNNKKFKVKLIEK